MMKNRAKECAVGITLVVVIALSALYLEGEPLDMTITGFVVKEDKVSYDHVIISGIEFKAEVQGKVYWYIYTDDKEWYETKDNVNWEKRVDMGDDIWEGLYYLKSYDAKIYFNDKLVEDIADLTRVLR